MKTITINLYSFHELNEPAKKKALKECSYINTLSEWWQFIYADANEYGLRITAFDLNNVVSCEGSLLQDAMDVAYKIKAGHEKDSPKYLIAQSFIMNWNQLVIKYSDGVAFDKVAEGNEQDFDIEADELEAEFLKSILDAYRLILHHQFAFLTSDAAIIETIEANDWHFTEVGKFYHP